MEIKKSNPKTIRKKERRGKIYDTKGSSFRGGTNIDTILLEIKKYPTRGVLLKADVSGIVFGSEAVDVSSGNFIGKAITISTNGDFTFHDGHFYPDRGSDLYDFGDSGSRWRTIYLVNSPNVSSDIRFKQKVQPLKQGLEEVKKINPISYERSDKKHFGFSAQELQKVLPDIVEDDGDQLSITPDELVPVLLNSVKELSKKVEDLEKRVKNNNDIM